MEESTPSADDQTGRPQEAPVHAHITLILPHQDHHRPPPPILNLCDGTDREAQITFREDDDERAELVGCPECLSALLKATSDAIDEALRAGRWLTRE